MGKKSQKKGGWNIQTASSRELIIYEILFIVCGILLALMGLVIFIALPFAVLCFYMAYTMRKELKRRKSTQEIPAPETNENHSVSTVNDDTPEPTQSVQEAEEKEPITQEEYDRLVNLCIDIHNEYKELMKEYKDADTDRKAYILKEAYRKISVIEKIDNAHNCYDELFVYDEYEKIEKKARSFINSYIKEEREDGTPNYAIDVTQFSFDLDFISDYIYDKQEKLDKM